ncbi:MAG TPA: branched-chain amino acid ABC transporter permease [Burkholderiaceae bacterium]|nr:branched-chain amino acid ABC transporter permease [Burkholderiaceae bacterium]
MLAPGLLILVLAALACLPLVASQYLMIKLIPAIAYGIALLGLNLLFGYTGLLSFGHALYVAIGAYTAAVLTGKLQWLAFEGVLAVAVLVAMAIAVPLGLLCVRYTKIFFGMLTLAFAMLFHSFLFKFYDLTGGDSGMRVARPALFGFTHENLDKTSYLIGPFYWYCLALLVLLAWLMWRIVHSPFGLHLKAIRDNPRKAEYLGVTVRRFRLIAFVISAGYAAIGGAILGVTTGLADPELAYWTHSGTMVFMLVLGGFGNFFGPLLGAGVYIALQDLLMSATQYWRAVLGITLVVIVILFPHGLIGLYGTLRGRWSRRTAAGGITAARQGRRPSEAA